MQSLREARRKREGDFLCRRMPPSYSLGHLLLLLSMLIKFVSEEAYRLVACRFLIFKSLIAKGLAFQGLTIL